MGNRRYIISFLLICLTVSHAFSFANDAYANGAVGALGLGGLEFVQENDISIEKEDLKITPGLVSVKYIFKNNSDKDKKVLIAFPLPPSDNHRRFSGLPYKFKVTVSGEQINSGAEYRAFVHNGNEEVTDLLKQYGIPIYGASDDKTTEIINSLDEESRDKLLTEGCFVRVWEKGSNRILRWESCWSVEAKFYWEQVFPAAKIIEIAVSYSPLSGSSDATYTLADAISYSTNVSRPLRGSSDGPFTLAHTSTNVSDGNRKCSSEETTWIKSILNAYPGYDANEISLDREHIKYILGPGSYWSGPIKEFELEVSGASYVNVCFDTEIDGDIIRIDSSTVKVHIYNFEPEGNIGASFCSALGAQKGGFKEFY